MADFWKPPSFRLAKSVGSSPPAPGELTLANRGLVIAFTHVPTNNTVYFKAFITAYNETFSSDWATESVYGRGDPIHLFKNTTRKITLAFKAPATSESEAYENLGKIQLLAQFLYPTYQDGDQAQTITQSPLIRLKVMNLLANMSGVDDVWAASSQNVVGPSEGLLGVINNLTFNHNLDTDVGVVEAASDVIFPKLIEVNLDFSAIHEHPLGWNDKGQFGQGLSGDNDGATFPYGIGATVAPETEPTAEVDSTAQAADPNDETANDPDVLPTGSEASAGADDAPTAEPDAEPQTSAQEAAKQNEQDNAAADVGEAAKEAKVVSPPPPKEEAEEPASPDPWWVITETLDDGTTIQHYYYLEDAESYQEDLTAYAQAGANITTGGY